MLSKRIYLYTSLLALIYLIVSCGKKVEAPSIENNVSYPGSIVALSSTQFLTLNTSANGDYKDGSIQLYSVDTSGNQTLQNSLSVPVHGSEIAVSPDSKLVALSFDNSVDPTQIQFYNYTTPSNPILINNLSLNFFNPGGKQSIKRLGFFTPSGGGNFYYLFGVIYSFPQNDGSNGNVPTRVFVAKIAKDFSSASIMFTLSNGIGDPNSLAPKSNSIAPYSYSFGSNSPTFDATHNLLIAFPTGSVSGAGNSSYTYPPYPSNIYDYFNKTSATANTVSCGNASVCSQPDLRVVSLFAVDFTAILNDEPLNNSVYYAPLAWNKNGIPYGATTNGVVVNYSSYNASGGSSNGDLNSFSFQNNFWSSGWVNTPHLGNGGASCYTTSNPTSIANEYDLSSLGSNGMLVAKTGTNGVGDTGYGNEIFQVSGLDILRSSINTIKSSRVAINLAGETDFNTIAPVQILDPYNTYYSTLQSTWLNGGVGPIVPYMYSRTTGVGAFDAMASAVINFNVLNFGSNHCLPYWVRDTYLGFGSWGMDSAWLSTSSLSMATPAADATFYNATLDPTQPFNFSFPYASGVQLCTDLAPVANTPKVYCANFLSGAITRYNASASGAIFNPF